MTFASKASSGVTIGIPDVCRVLTPPAGIPLPYPSFATTAVKIQQQKLGAWSKVAVSGAVSQTRGDRTDTLKSATSQNMLSLDVAIKGSEVQRIKSEMNQLNSKLQSMQTSDPNHWQAVLTDFAVLSSALYTTLTSDND